MRLFFIRHIPSGKYLPMPTGRNGRGGSHVEPDIPEHARIFRSQRSAKITLNAWLKGKWIAERGYDPGTPDRGDEYYEDIHIVPQPERNAADMEIIERSITL